MQMGNYTLEHRPKKVMFIGRATPSKGVFDILEMAQSIDRTDPGLVRWTICGTAMVSMHSGLNATPWACKI